MHILILYNVKLNLMENVNSLFLKKCRFIPLWENSFDFIVITSGLTRMVRILYSWGCITSLNTLLFFVFIIFCILNIGSCISEKSDWPHEEISLNVMHIVAYCYVYVVIMIMDASLTCAELATCMMMEGTQFFYCNMNCCPRNCFSYTFHTCLIYEYFWLLNCKRM